MEELELKTLKKYIKNKIIYIFFCFDKNDQYSSLTEVNNHIKNISKELEKNSIIYYFGELPNKEKPDIDEGELYNTLCNETANASAFNLCKLKK